MAKTLLSKLKIISDMIKDNKWLILLFLSIGVTNAGQFIYMQPEPNKPTEIIKEKVVTKTIVKEVDYSKVHKLLKRHIKELH